MRAAIYARFSSDLQDERSITDQITLARKYVETRGLTLTQTYQDAAISGASTMNRPGLQNLLADALVGRFNIIVTESLDRLSRSQADIASLYERLTFLGVRIEPLADGAVSEIHVGLKGTMAALFLKDLAQKTRRGQVGRVKAGRIPGGKSYGYDIIHKGEERGLRAVNDVEAEVVRRIFKEYAGGKGTLAIVAGLNKERVAGPTGGLWTASALLGSPKRRNGLLNNELYKGTIVYNRQRFIKDPATGKRVARENPESEWHRQEAPELRIVDQETWDAVQAKRGERAGPHLYHRRRPKRLLSGLLRCGCCGGSYSVVRDDVMRCSTLSNSGACDNRRTVRTGDIEGRVLAALQRHLLAPDVVAAAVEAYREERQRLAGQRRRRQGELSRDLAAVKRKIESMLELVMDRAIDTKVAGRKLMELEAEQERLEAELAQSPASDVIAVHPQASERYRSKVAEIHDALKQGDGAAREAINLLRELIDHIVVTPTQRPEPVGLQVVGNLAALLVDAPSGAGGAESMVAGACSMRSSDAIRFEVSA